MVSLEKVLIEELTKDVDGTRFYICLNNKDGQEINKLIKETIGLISKYNLSVSESKGFLEYMKLIIDASAYLPQKK